VKCLTEIFPRLRGWGEAPCRTFSVDAVAASGAVTVFLATPHESIARTGAAAFERGPARGGPECAFRFRDPETFARWYKLRRRPANWGGSRLRLPELYADQLPDARLVANPGCYPTSVILGLRRWWSPTGSLASAASSVIANRARRERARTETRSALCRGGRKFTRLRLFRTGTRRK